MKIIVFIKIIYRTALLCGASALSSAGSDVAGARATVARQVTPYCFLNTMADRLFQAEWF